MSPSTSESTNRRPEYVTLIAIYQFITAAILFLLSCMIPVVVYPMIFSYIGGSEEIFVAMSLVTAALAMAVGFGFASIVVGYGLLRMKNWGRLGAIVLGAFALIGFPVWTIVAVLVLVYLTSDEARDVFTKASDRDPSTGKTPAPENHAVYKAEPAPEPDYHPLQDTRPMTTAASTSAQPEGPATIPPDDETRRIEPIPMPPPDDPAESTESFYDNEADVSDHYRRWKASLEQKPSSPGVQEDEGRTPEDQITTEMEVIEPPAEPEEPEQKPKRKWVVPPEEAGMDNRILGRRDDQAEDEDSGNQSG